MLITKILTDPCAIRQNIKIKNTFADNCMFLSCHVRGFRVIKEMITQLVVY